MLKGNSFTRDKDDERRERLVLLSANIGDFELEFGLAPDKLAAAAGALVAWDDAVSAATREAGETHEATQELQTAFETAKKYYAKAKEHLLAVIYEMEKPDRIVDAYGFNKDVPRTYDGLCQALKVWIDEHAVLVAEADPRVVNASVVANLEAYLGEIDTLKRARALESEEESSAFAAKSALFDVHSKLLDFIYTIACLTWNNDDDSRLELLGFVPASEVWTPGQPEPEEPEEPEEPTEFYGTVTFVGEGAYDFWCSKPEGVENAKVELQVLPDGLVQFVTDIMLVEEGKFVPHRIFDMAVGDYRAYFTPLDADDNPVGDTVTVDFTVEG